MKKYCIQSRVKTGLEILADYAYNEDVGKRFKSEFDYEGFHFQQWDFSVADGALGDSWILTGETEAENSISAINKYLKKQNEILSRIFFCIPVWHSYGFHHPLLISNDNFQTGYYFMRIESKGVGLNITPEILSLIKRQSFANIPKKFFSFYSEFINASTALSGLSLGCIALESILPQGKVSRKEILGDDLYFSIFSSDISLGRKQGFRNRIFHGIYFDDGDNTEKDYHDLLEAIKLALISKNADIKNIFNLQSNFKGIPRQKSEINGYNGIFLEAGDDGILDIKTLVESDNESFSEFKINISNKFNIKTHGKLNIENY